MQRRPAQPSRPARVGSAEALYDAAMLRPAALGVSLAAVALAGSGCRTATPKLPRSCTRGPGTVLAALRAAPGHVALSDGTKLSTCVNRARADSEIQTIGLIWTQAADGLARDVKFSDASALRLGYLVGATARGASTTNGIHQELVRRLQQSAGLEGAPRAHRGAYRRGLASGRRGG